MAASGFAQRFAQLSVPFHRRQRFGPAGMLLARRPVHGR